MKIIFKIIFLDRVRWSFDERGEEVPHRRVILSDSSGSYLAMLHGEDATYPFFAEGDEVLATLRFEVVEHYGKLSNEITVLSMEKLEDFSKTNKKKEVFMNQKTLLIDDEICQQLEAGGPRFQGTVGLSPDGKMYDFHPHRRKKSARKPKALCKPEIHVTLVYNVSINYVSNLLKGGNINDRLH